MAWQFLGASPFIGILVLVIAISLFGATPFWNKGNRGNCVGYECLAPNHYDFSSFVPINNVPSVSC